MDQTQRIILVGFATGGSEAEIDAVAADLRLSRTLLRRGLVTQAELAAGVELRNESGLLLEHCLVRLGFVEFDAMLEAMAERRRAQGAPEQLRRALRDAAHCSPDRSMTR